MPAHGPTPAAETSTAMLRRHVSSASDHLVWVLRDVLRHFKLRALMVVLLQLLGTTAGAATVGGVVLYARFLESGTPIHFAGLTINLSRKTSGVVTFSAALAVLGIFSAACLYISQWIVLKTAVRYLRLNVQRLLLIAADPAYRGWGALAAGRGQVELLRLTGYSAQITALIMRRMLNGILPIIVFLFAGTALIIVSPGLTALLIPLMLAYLLPLYRITRGAAAIQVEYLRSNRAARAILRSTLLRVTGLSTRTEQKLKDVDQSLAAPERAAAEDAYCRKRLAEDRVHLLNTVFFVLCAFVLFAYFAINVGRGDQKWSELLLYIVALRFAVAELRRVTGLMVILSRCLPEFSRYRRFVDAAEALRIANTGAASSKSVLPAALSVSVHGEPLWDGDSSVEVQRGGILWVLLPWRPAHVDLEMIASRLTGGRLPAQMLCFAGASDDHESLAARMTAHVRAEWTQLGVADELRDMIAQTGEDDRREAARNLGREATLTLAASDLLKPHELIVIAAPVLRAMDESFVASLMDMHRGGYVVLAAQDPRHVLDPEFEQLHDRVAGVAVLRDGRFVSCGDLDWLTANLNPLRNALRPRPIDDGDLADLEQDEDEEF